MAKCKECNQNFGLIGLKNGVCSGCIRKKTPNCHGCGTAFEIDLLTEGFCNVCHPKEIQRRKGAKLSRDREAKRREVESLTEEQLQKVILTTESNSSLEILERIDIVTAECAYGMNIFKDIFTSVRDIVGGRSAATQKMLRDARKTVLTELRREAYSIGANAVVAVDLDYSEFSGGGKSMLFIVASGTAVKLRELADE